jgi:protein-L-isoaspartate(D-aspartate) O-methyltransferase
VRASCWPEGILQLQHREQMTSENELRTIRRAYARQITAATQVVDQRVQESFAEIPRERFLGSGPWLIYRPGRGYVKTPSCDPVYLYTDDVVGIVPDLHLNNGQPSLHALLLASAAPREGEHVVHVGAGCGYYTAIMGRLVGLAGCVTAIEMQPGLAASAKRNLSTYANIAVLEGDGSVVPFDLADVIYVNAGATRLPNAWLDRLRDGGRLILPLTTDEGFHVSRSGIMQRRGAGFMITREGEQYPAKWLSAVAIYPCMNLRDEFSERALSAALKGNGWTQVTRLYRTDDFPLEQCWLQQPGWCLAYR